MQLSSLEESGRSFYTWNYVSALMVEEFRHEVMRTAWKHRPKAPISLRKFATQAFLGAIHVITTHTMTSLRVFFMPVKFLKFRTRCSEHTDL